MKKHRNSFHIRVTALLLALLCIAGLFPTQAMAVGDTIKLDSFGMSGVAYESAALGRCSLHQMFYASGSETVAGFCGTKGGGMGQSLIGQTWGHKTTLSDPTVSMMMAYYYAHSTGVFTDRAEALGVNTIWDTTYTWYMNAWVQAIIWRYQQGSMSDPVVACAEELMAVYNSLEGTHYTSIDQEKDGTSFRSRSKYILDLGAQGVWGDCSVYEYTFTGAGSSTHPASSVQKVVLGELNVTHDEYTLIIKKVDSTNPTKGLQGAEFHVQAENGSYSRDVVTGPDGTCVLDGLTANTFAVTETAPPPGGYEIDNAGPEYVVLPNGSSSTVTVTFTNSLPATGKGSIRKVDADNPTKGLAGAVIKITGIDNNFVGTYTTGAGGYLTDVPWDQMPVGSYTSEETTPPEGYTKSTDQSKVKQTFVWDGKSDVSLIFENDAKVKVRLIKLDDSGNPLPGAVFNIIRDGQIIGAEATTEDGSITVTDVTEGMYAFVEVSAPSPWAKLTEPVFAHVDQAIINGGGTVTVTAADKRLPSLSILKRDAQTKEVIPGTVFEVKGIHYGYHNDVTTGPDGKAVLTNIPVDSYEIIEKSVPDPYVVGDEPMQTIYLGPGEERELIFDNLKQPLLTIAKLDADTNDIIPGTVFTIEAIDGDYRNDVTTGADGTVSLRLAPGSYKITEKSVPAPYYLPSRNADREQTVSLNPGDEKTVTFKDHKAPELTIFKEDSVAGAPIEGAKFHVTYTSNGEAADAPGSIDYGYIFTDANGQIKVHEQGKKMYPGEYTVTEVAPAPGFQMKEPTTQRVIIHGGESKTLTFQNEPLNGIIVEKYDSVTHEALPGCTFQLRFLGGTSGTGGTVIGQKVTGKNGTAIWTGLTAGTYIVEEVDPGDGYSIIKSSETIYISDDGVQNVITVTFDNAPDGLLLIRKVCSVNPSITLQDAEFKVTYADGTMIGDSNGVYRTDENGEIRISGLKPGKSVIVTETKAPAGFLIDTQSQTIQIREGRTVSLTFKNQPTGKLIVQKRDSITGQPLPGVEFRITTAAGCEVGLDGVIGTSTLTQNGIFKTDSNGEIRISNLAPGAYVLTEIKSLPGYVMDSPSTNVVIGTNGDTQTVVVTNTPKGGLLIRKTDGVTGAPLPGVKFKIIAANGELIPDNEGLTSSNGLYTTDENGQIYLRKLNPNTYVVSEVETVDGYLLNAAPQTVVVSEADTQVLSFTNMPLGGLLVKKMDSATKEPLADVIFKITRTDGTVVGNSNGEYRTDERGFISLPDLEPGGYIVREVQAKSGYLLDDTPHAVEIKDHQTYTLEVFNQPLGNLIINKLSSLDNSPLEGVKFRIKYANGQVVDNKNGQVSSNGIYFTDRNGQIILSGITGTIVVTELETVPGYRIDPNTRTQTVVVNPNDTQTINFYNTPTTTLIIRKFVEGTENEPLSGVAFRVVDGAGAAVGPDDGLYYTDKSGEIVLTGIEPGTTVIAREIKTVEGYILDGTPQDILIKAGEVQQLTFWNKKAGTLVIEKYVTGTTDPLKGVTFLVTESNGQVVGSSNGEYITDENGRIVIEGLEPGVTVTAREIKTLEGYVLDTTPKSIKIKVGEAQTLRFYNQKQGCIVVKKLDKQTGEPLAGVEFQITYSDGSYLDDDYGHLSSKGLYKTDANGEIRISGVVGTLVITETKPLPGYVMDEGTKTQTVRVNAADTQTITVYNTKVGGLTIIKTDEETGERISGVQFEIRKLNGEIVGNYTTDRSGVISLPEAEKGWYQVVELKAAKGYKLDDTPHQIEVKDGGTATLEITNRQIGSALIHKVDSLTGEGIYGVTFLLSDAKGNPVGTYQSDNEGYVYIDQGLADGKYTIREIECADGYILDTVPKTFYVEYGGCTTITWPNTAVRGQIQVIKKSADYNSTNGLPAGTLLEGATFEIYNERNGNKVDTIVTGANGLASSKALPLGRYTIRETKAPANYGASSETYTAVLEYSGQIVKLEITNKSLSTGVSIEKTGPKEATSGQPVRYVFSRIGNNSNVMLQSFYWRDTLPAAVRLDKVVTGTYNFPGTYKIMYKVNNTGDYRTLADSLSTSRNYTLAASPTALGLAANERVTEIMFVFGQVPGGFSQVEAPMLHCKALSGLTPGSSFVNVADVGGTYSGVWVQAVTRWVTAVYGKPVKLPRTGY